jgi:hypothetical protein
MTTLGVTVPYYGGRQSENPSTVFQLTTVPSPNIRAKPGDIAVNTSTGTIYGAATVAAGNQVTWAVLGGSTGAVATINSLSPVGGNIVLAGTANQITATSAGHTVTFSLPSAITTPGSLLATTSLAATTSVTAGTTLTATLGNIIATNGNLVLSTLGNKLVIPAGTNGSVGVTAAMSGSPGSISVASTAITTSSVILFSRATTGGTPGNVSISAQSTGNFTLLSTGNETSTFNYLIIN